MYSWTIVNVLLAAGHMAVVVAAPLPKFGLTSPTNTFSPINPLNPSNPLNPNSPSNLGGHEDKPDAPPAPPAALPYPRLHLNSTCPVTPGNAGFSIGGTGKVPLPFDGKLNWPEHDQTEPQYFVDSVLTTTSSLDDEDMFNDSKQLACRRIAHTSWTGHKDTTVETTALLLRKNIRYAWGVATSGAVKKVGMYRTKDGVRLWAEHFDKSQGQEGGRAIVEFALKDDVEVFLAIDTDNANNQGEIALYHEGP